MIVAINKIGKLDANVDRVKKERPLTMVYLLRLGRNVIRFQYQLRKVRGTDLLEMILLQAERFSSFVQIRQACYGNCIEARLDKSKDQLLHFLLLMELSRLDKCRCWYNIR